MEINCTIQELTAYTTAQLNTFFPIKTSVDAHSLSRSIGTALERVEFCFQHITHRDYTSEAKARFNIFHSDQYCAYLYFLSNTIYKADQNVEVASKLFYLNKSLHAFNCMYDTNLPDIFWLQHTVGIVLGKAEYADFLVVRQNCTIGALSGHYPVLGERLILSAGASVIGKCQIGKNVMIGPGCTVLKKDVPDNTLVTSNETLTYRANSHKAFESHFSDKRSSSDANE